VIRKFGGSNDGWIAALMNGAQPKPEFRTF
jgi:hypothetical protein